MQLTSWLASMFSPATRQRGWRSHNPVSAERLEDRTLLAVTFGPEQVIGPEIDGPNAVLALDIDADGDIDVVSGSDDEVAWYENTDGAGTFGPQQIISADVSSVNSLFAADIDGDGNPDILTVSTDDKVAWYRNTDGNGMAQSKSSATQQRKKMPLNSDLF